MVATTEDTPPDYLEVWREWELFFEPVSDFIEADSWTWLIGEALSCNEVQSLVFHLPEAERQAIAAELQSIVAEWVAWEVDCGALANTLMLLDGMTEDGPLPAIWEMDDPVTAKIIGGGAFDGAVICMERRHLLQLRAFVLPLLVQVDDGHYEIRFRHSSFN